jgi:hypothetical protein
VVLERAKGIEPSYAAWEAAVLPLNYARGAKLFSITGPLCKFPCSIPVNFSAVCFDMFERPNQRFVFGKYGFHRTQRNARLSSRSPSRSYQRPCARRTCSGFQASIIRTAFLNSARCPQKDSRMSSGDLPSGSTTPPIRSSARSHGERIRDNSKFSIRSVRTSVRLGRWKKTISERMPPETTS